MSINIDIDPILCNLFGSVNISLYGVMIAIGVLVFYRLSCLKIKKLFSYITEQDLESLFCRVFLGALLGGRIFWALNEADFGINNFFYVWQGGLSILGAILGGLTSLFYTIYKKRWDFKIVSILATYAPLAQMFGRMGCFFAGCCHGKFCDNSLAVTYLNNNSLALCNVPIYPTQLYSAAFYLGLFVFLRYFVFNKNYKLVFSFYLLAMALERFLIDFLRGDRQIIKIKYFDYSLSSHQYVSLLIILVVLLILGYQFRKKISLGGDRKL